MKKQGDVYTLQAIGKEPWSVFTYKFSRDVKENNRAGETALYFAKAMSSQNFKRLSEYADDKMKGFFRFKRGYKSIKRNVGSFHKKCWSIQIL